MMSFSKTARALLALCGLSALLALSAWHWRSSYLHEKQKSESAVTLAAQRQQVITEMQQRQQDVAALDAEYTQELTGARMENDRLRADIAAGRRRLRVRGTCQLPGATAPSGVGHAGTVGLASETGQAVFYIRSGIITDQQKLRFLQQYIREVCLKSPHSDDTPPVTD